MNESLESGSRTRKALLRESTWSTVSLRAWVAWCDLETTRLLHGETRLLTWHRITTLHWKAWPLLNRIAWLLHRKTWLHLVALRRLHWVAWLLHGISRL